jgi:hypothetical protein
VRNNECRQQWTPGTPTDDAEQISPGNGNSTSHRESASGRIGPPRPPAAPLVLGERDGGIAGTVLSIVSTVNTFAGLIGGAVPVPVPGGLGVVEAGLIAGLSAVGIPQDQAVAAVLIQRFFTSYLPPVWGWATLAWMRRREYV